MFRGFFGPSKSSLVRSLPWKTMSKNPWIAISHGKISSNHPFRRFFGRSPITVSWQIPWFNPTWPPWHSPASLYWLMWTSPVYSSTLGENHVLRTLGLWVWFLSVETKRIYCFMSHRKCRPFPTRWLTPDSEWAMIQHCPVTAPPQGSENLEQPPFKTKTSWLATHNLSNRKICVPYVLEYEFNKHTWVFPSILAPSPGVGGLHQHSQDSYSPSQSICMHACMYVRDKIG